MSTPIDETASSPDDGVRREPWDIIRAIAVVREIEPLVRPLGLFTSLTGGVLYKGWSAKDLDIAFGQTNRRGFPHGGLARVLEGLGWTRLRSAADVTAWRQKREPDGGSGHHVAVWLTPENRRVDVFAWMQDGVQRSTFIPAFAADAAERASSNPGSVEPF